MLFLVWFALYSGAAARLTHLVTTDVITAPVREWITERADARAATRPLGVLINCNWCASVWIVAAVAVLDAAATGPLAEAVHAAYAAPVLGWLIIGAALALAAGMLATITR